MEAENAVGETARPEGSPHQTAEGAEERLRQGNGASEATLNEPASQAKTKVENAGGETEAAQHDTRQAGERLTVPVGAQEVAFRWCPAGTFTMGSRAGSDFFNWGGESGRFDNERQHQVTLTRGFWMGETEVTQGLWMEVMEDNPSYFKRGDNYPVEQVSWEDCQQFVQALNSRWPQDGLRWALPTEAQWEYACRAGTTGAYGGTGVLAEMAWYDGIAFFSHTHPVGGKQANAWGLFDMHGNVCEWCADGFREYPSGPVTDPTGAEDHRLPVFRGGSWNHGATDCRSARRAYNIPSHRINYLGVRVALLPVR